MKILAFDTTNQTLSVAILSDEKIIAQKNILESNKHSEMLIPSIEECLKSAEIWYQDLDLIAFTNGPGSFTGIRVGYSCAKALQIATGLPIVAVNSLETVAFGYCLEKKYQKILVVNDAKLDEFFLQEFRVGDGEIEASFEPLLIPASDVEKFFPAENFLLAGSAKFLILTNTKSGLQTLTSARGGEVENMAIDEKEDFIDAKNIAILGLKQYLKNNNTKSEALYIRQPKISKRKTKSPAAGRDL